MSFPRPNAGDSAKIQSGAETIEAEEIRQKAVRCMELLSQLFIGGAPPPMMPIIGFLKTVICHVPLIVTGGARGITSYHPASIQ